MGNMKYSQIIGNNIKSCLSKHEMSIVKYAALINVTRQTASSYLNGIKAIPSDKLYITAGYFDKTIGWFLEKSHIRFKFLTYK